MGSPFESFVSNLHEFFLMPFFTVMLPVVTILLLKDIGHLFQNPQLENRPSPVVEPQENFDWVSGSTKLLAAFISLVIVGVSMLFVFQIHDIAKCDKFTCPKARFLGPKDSDPYANFTIDFYCCEDQRTLLKSIWSQELVFLGPLIETGLAFTSLAFSHIRSMTVVKALKIVHAAAAVYYTSFVSNFQYYFDSVSDVMAYVRSAFTIFMLTLVLFFMSACSETQRQLNRMVMTVMVIIGIVLLVHIGYSGYHLMCGRSSVFLPGYLASHGCLVFSFAMFRDDVFPQAILLMSLFFVPPVCPFVIALTAWSFDSFWRDLVDAGMRIELFGCEPSIPRIPGRHLLDQHNEDEFRFRRRDVSAFHSRRMRARRCHPIRGLY